MYKRTEQGWLKHLDFILLDVLCTQLAFVLAYSWRFGFHKLMCDEIIYRNLAIWMSVFGVVIAVMFNTMHDVLKRRWTTEIRYTLAQCGMVFAMVFAMVVVYLFSVKDSEKYSRLVLWNPLAIYAVFAYLLRVAWKQLLRHRKQSEPKRAMLLVADEASVHEIIHQFEAHPLENIALCGLVLADRDAVGETIDGIDVVANLNDAAKYICREWIAVSGSNSRGCELQRSNTS